MFNNWLHICVSGCIKALLLRQKNDYLGDAFGHASAAFRQAAAAAEIEDVARGNKKLLRRRRSRLYCSVPFLLRGAAIEELRNRRKIRSHCGALLLQRPTVEKRSAAIRALLYGPYVFCSNDCL